MLFKKNRYIEETVSFYSYPDIFVAGKQFQ